MSARDRILGRIRAVTADLPDVEIPRAYDRTRSLDLLETLVDRLTDYRAQVHLIDPRDLPGLLGDMLAGARVVRPSGLPDLWTDALQVVPDEPPLSASALDAVDAVLTTCAVAIAETGTIVLDGGPGQGRRALTLVPDHHVCVVDTAQIVSTVAEALPHLDPRRPLTWISGPSATSDIELNRVEGVHGPRTLTVVLLAHREQDPKETST